MQSLEPQSFSFFATDVDVLQVDVVLPANSREGDDSFLSPPSYGGGSRQGTLSRRASKGSTVLDASDLKNYEYEGECAFPGSLTTRKCGRQRHNSDDCWV